MDMFQYFSFLLDTVDTFMIFHVPTRLDTQALSLHPAFGQQVTRKIDVLHTFPCGILQLQPLENVGHYANLCQLSTYSKAECHTHQTSGHVCRRLPSLIFRALCCQFLHVMTSNDMTTCPDMTICRSSNHASMGEECRDQTQRLSSRRFLTKASVKVNLVGICTDFG